LRAVAVLAIVIFHGFPDLLPGGFIGVDIFFVISGFLISNILLTDLAHGQFSFQNFYTSRIRRIFAALIIVLVVTLIIVGLFYWRVNSRTWESTPPLPPFFSKSPAVEADRLFRSSSRRQATAAFMVSGSRRAILFGLAINTWSAVAVTKNTDPASGRLGRIVQRECSIAGQSRKTYSGSAVGCAQRITPTS
jgi:hypothetical protein